MALPLLAVLPALPEAMAALGAVLVRAWPLIVRAGSWALKSVGPAALGYGLAKIGDGTLDHVMGAAAKGLDMKQLSHDVGVDAGYTQEQADALNAQLYATANQEGIKVDVNDLGTVVTDMYTLSGDQTVALDNMDRIATYMKATGDTADTTGRTLGILQRDHGIKSAEDIEKVAGVLYAFGPERAYLNDKMSRDSSQTHDALYASKLGGAEAVEDYARGVHALTPLLGKGFGGAERAYTSIYKNLDENDKVKEFLKENHIDLWEHGPNGEKTRRKPITELIPLMMKAAGPNAKDFAARFDGDAKEAMQKLIPEASKETSAFTETMAVDTDVSRVQTVAEQKAKAAASNLQVINNTAIQESGEVGNWLIGPDDEAKEPEARGGYLKEHNQFYMNHQIRKYLKLHPDATSAEIGEIIRENNGYIPEELLISPSVNGGSEGENDPNGGTNNFIDSIPPLNSPPSLSHPAILPPGVHLHGGQFTLGSADTPSTTKQLDLTSADAPSARALAGALVSGPPTQSYSGEIVVRVEAAEGLRARVERVTGTGGPVDLAVVARTGPSMGAA